MLNVYQTAKQVDCGEVMDRACQPGRLTAGGRGKWQCPFHDDHDPSLVTYPSEPGNPSHFYCFACGAHGDSIDLYAKLSRTAPLDAARALCKQWGLTYDKPAPRGASSNKQPPAPDSDPRLAIVLAICGEWQRYRIKWFEEQIAASEARLTKGGEADGGEAAWAIEMEKMWRDYYETQLAKHRKMNEWEVLHDIRSEFEALGVNPYRRVHIAGTAT